MNQVLQLDNFGVYKRNLRNMGGFNRIECNPSLSPAEKIRRTAELHVNIFLGTNLQDKKVNEYLHLLCTEIIHKSKDTL